MVTEASDFLGKVATDYEANAGGNVNGSANATGEGEADGNL